MASDCKHIFGIDSKNEATNFEREPLNTSDYSVLGIYFFLILFVGLYSMLKNSRSTVGGYFLANKSMTWPVIGASIFASNIGSGHFVGLAGSGAKSGYAVASYELNGMLVILLLGYLFAPVYISSKCTTMPEYLKLRFGGNRINIMISVISLLIYIFTKISVDLYAGAIFIQQAMSMSSIWMPIVILLVISALFTVGGGLAAVIYTDTIQTVIMLGGGIYVAIRAFSEIGGFKELKTRYMDAKPECFTLAKNELTENVTFIGNISIAEAIVEKCGSPDKNSFHIARDLNDEDFPWLGIITGMTINSIWYWCSDQVIVQRCLAAKNLLHAKAATILASYLKISIIFIMVMPGMISRILFKELVGCADKENCQKFCHQDSCNDVAYPYLITQIIPHGLIGLMIAVMLSALMSSLTSIFNSASSIFTIDIWPLLRNKFCNKKEKDISERELMIVGRVFVLILVIMSVFWIPVVQTNQTGSLFTYIQMISSYLQPPICAVYIMGLFVPGTNEIGVFYGLVSGLFLGISRMIIDMIFERPSCSDLIFGKTDSRPFFTKHFSYLYFSCFLFIATIIITYSISFINRKKFTKPKAGTTWSTRFEPYNKAVESQAYHAAETLTRLEKSNFESELSKQNIDQETKMQETTNKNDNILVSLMKFFCGLDDQYLDNAGRRKAKKINTNPLEEDKKWKLVVDINLVIVLLISASMWFYFG